MNVSELLFPDPPLGAYPLERVRNGQAAINGTYSSGADWSVKIDRTGVLLRSNLRLVGSVSTGASANGSARTRNPLLLLGNKVIARVNGKEEISCHPDVLYFRASWRRGRLTKLQRDSLTTTEMDTDSTTYDFSVQLPFDFMLPGVFPDHVGAIITGNAPDIELAGTWGTIASVASSTTNHALTGVSLAVFNERVNAELTPDQAAMGFGHFMLRQIERSIASTETLQIEIPGARAYAAIYIRAEAGSTPEPSDSVLTSTGYIRIKRGSQVLFEKSVAEVLSDTAAGLEPSETRTGWYAVDFLRLGHDAMGILSRTHLTSSSQPLLLEIDVTTSTGAKLQVVTEEVVDPLSSANQRYRM